MQELGLYRFFLIFASIIYVISIIYTLIITIWYLYKIIMKLVSLF